MFDYETSLMMKYDENDNRYHRFTECDFCNREIPCDKDRNFSKNSCGVCISYGSHKTGHGFRKMTLCRKCYELYLDEPMSALMSRMEWIDANREPYPEDRKFKIINLLNSIAEENLKGVC